MFLFYWFHCQELSILITPDAIDYKISLFRVNCKWATQIIKKQLFNIESSMKYNLFKPDVQTMKRIGIKAGVGNGSGLNIWYSWFLVKPFLSSKKTPFDHFHW